MKTTYLSRQTLTQMKGTMSFHSNLASLCSVSSDVCLSLSWSELFKHTLPLRTRSPYILKTCFIYEMGCTPKLPSESAPHHNYQKHVSVNTRKLRRTRYCSTLSYILRTRGVSKALGLQQLTKALCCSAQTWLVRSVLPILNFLTGSLNLPLFSPAIILNIS